jgi:CheY-like chemotaxis protein
VIDTVRVPGESVLVVEHDEAVLEILCRLIGYVGYDCVAARNGFEALAQSSHDAPRVALVDLLLPGMSGPHLIAALRRDRPNLPVIVMTGSTATDEEILELHPVAFLRKPFDFDTLHVALSVALE